LSCSKAFFLLVKLFSIFFGEFMVKSKAFYFLMTSPGMGTHLVMDLIRPTSLKIVPNTMIGFLGAIIYSQRNQGYNLCDWNCVEKDFHGMTVKDIVKGYYNKYEFNCKGDLLDLDNIKHFFKKWLISLNSDSLCTVNLFCFTTVTDVRLSNGTIMQWSSEDRDAARKIFIESLLFAGFDVHHMGIIRHPINTYLSKYERFNRSKEFNRDLEIRMIINYFDLCKKIRNDKNCFILKYENICSDKKYLIDFYKYIGLTEKEIANYDLSYIHKGELNKWRNHPIGRTKELANTFERILYDFEYDYQTKNRIMHFLQQIYYKAKKIHNEIRLLNKIFAGDHCAEGVYFRHKLSISGRIYKHLNCMIPSRKNRLIEYYMKYKGLIDDSMKDSLSKKFTRILKISRGD